MQFALICKPIDQISFVCSLLFTCKLNDQIITHCGQCVLHIWRVTISQCTIRWCCFCDASRCLPLLPGCFSTMCCDVTMCCGVISLHHHSATDLDRHSSAKFLARMCEADGQLTIGYDIGYRPTAVTWSLVNGQHGCWQPFSWLDTGDWPLPWDGTTVLCSVREYSLVIGCFCLHRVEPFNESVGGEAKTFINMS